MTWGMAVYLLCFAASMACALLLIRSYLREQASLLLWSSICFSLLALNNLVVVVDMLVLRDMDLMPWRQVTSLAAVGVLLYAFIWRSDG
jgi:hypothetical protein